jgi:hypothetical protein
MKADEAFAQVQTWFSGQVTAHPVRELQSSRNLFLVFPQVS